MGSGSEGMQFPEVVAAALGLVDDNGDDDDDVDDGGGDVVVTQPLQQQLQKTKVTKTRRKRSAADVRVLYIGAATYDSPGYVCRWGSVCGGPVRVLCVLRACMREFECT